MKYDEYKALEISTIMIPIYLILAIIIGKLISNWLSDFGFTGVIIASICLAFIGVVIYQIPFIILMLINKANKRQRK